MRFIVYLSVETFGINAVIIGKFMLSFIEFLYCLKQNNIDVRFVLFRGGGGYILLLLYIVTLQTGTGTGTCWQSNVTFGNATVR